MTFSAKLELTVSSKGAKTDEIHVFVWNEKPSELSLRFNTDDELSLCSARHHVTGYYVASEDSHQRILSRRQAPGLVNVRNISGL